MYMLLLLGTYVNGYTKIYPKMMPRRGHMQDARQGLQDSDTNGQDMHR